MFVIGVDAGATKTHAIALEDSGKVLGIGHAGCGSHEAIGFVRARDALDAAIRQALEQAGKPLRDARFASFCLAGVDIQHDMVHVPKEMLEPILGGVAFLLKNDAFGCLRGGTRDPFGIMINCGSGQVAVGRNREGVEIRVGGYGWDFGDFGGGNVMTQSALAAVVRADDGRGAPTALLDLILQASGHATIPDFLEKAYRDGEYVRSLGIPRLVFRSSAAGDSVARSILKSVAEEMAVTANTLIRRLRMEKEAFDLITAGSVFRGEDPWFLETIHSLVLPHAPSANFRFPLYAPAVGAGLLALEAVGIQANDSLYGNLDRSLPAEFRS